MDENTNLMDILFEDEEQNNEEQEQSDGFCLMSIIAVDSVTGAVTLNKGELYRTYLKLKESMDNVHLKAMHATGFLSAFPNNELSKQLV